MKKKKSNSKKKASGKKAPPKKAAQDSIFGYMAGKVKIVGDIVSPAVPLEDWDCLKE